jgi:hypothetical protein
VGRAIKIDLGTTFCVAAAMQGGKSVIISSVECINRQVIIEMCCGGSWLRRRSGSIITRRVHRTGDGFLN